MFLIRLLIVGETGVGKTSLILRFHEDHFTFNQKTTIGVDYKAKEIALDGEMVKLQVIIIFFDF
jgi:GTPase SAR1 family protein